LRRDKQRKEPTGKTTLLHTWKIQMPFLNARKKGASGIVTMMQPQIKQQVVMTIEGFK